MSMLALIHDITNENQIFFYQNLLFISKVRYLIIYIQINIACVFVSHQIKFV